MKEIGKFGEKLVSSWLETQGYKVLNEGWHCRWGEIDLVVCDRSSQTIVFVEVKTRSQHNWDEDGLLAVDTVKQQKIWKTASLFLAQNPQLAELPCRFDVALVSYGLAANSIESDRFSSQTLIAQNQYRFTLKKYLKSAFDVSL